MSSPSQRVRIAIERLWECSPTEMPKEEFYEAVMEDVESSIWEEREERNKHMLVGTVNVSKIDKKFLIDGKKGKYLDLVIFENRDGEDEYGNTHVVYQGVGKEARARGERGPIIGNLKTLGNEKRNSAPAKDDDGDDIPF